MQCNEEWRSDWRPDWRLDWTRRRSLESKTWTLYLYIFILYHCLVWLKRRLEAPKSLLGRQKVCDSCWIECLNQRHLQSERLFEEAVPKKVPWDEIFKLLIEKKIDRRKRQRNSPRMKQRTSLLETKEEKSSKEKKFQFFTNFLFCTTPNLCKVS